MKRILCISLLSIILLSLCTACKTLNKASEQMVYPVEFYYRRTSIDYGTEDGVISAQTVDIGTSDLEYSELLQQYLDYPVEEGLESPFPKQTQILSINTGNNVITVQLGGAYAGLTGIQATIADACIAKTLLSYTEAEKILLLITDEAGQTVRSKKIAECDVLLFDDSSSTDSTSVTLYYTDETARYLIPERRTIPYMTEAELPTYIIEQLLAGPETIGLKPTLPDGTLLLDINVDNAICAVDFSADFLNNRPQTVSEERMAILSVVNSLTALDSIEQVQFYIEGRRQERLSFLNLSGQFVSDSHANGPFREDLNEFDATIYLPTEGSGLLYAIPARLKLGSETIAESVLQMLSDYEPKNGLLNPLFGKPLPIRVQIERGCCILHYPETTVFGETAETELAAIRSIIASLTALEGVEEVKILLQDMPATFNFIEMPETIQPQPEWYVDATDVKTP